MKTHRKALVIYSAVLVGLAFTTLAALYDGGYHTEGFAIALVAIASTITSLLPFFCASYLFKKQEAQSEENRHVKVWAWLIFLCCFPVKIIIIVSNIKLLILGGNAWAFG